MKSFLRIVKIAVIVKVLDSLPRNNAGAELCFGEIIVAYCRDLV
jgi:hypothetical protein